MNLRQTERLERAAAVLGDRSERQRSGAGTVGLWNIPVGIPIRAVEP